MQQERREHNGHLIYSTKGKSSCGQAFECMDHVEMFLSLLFHVPLESPSAKNLMLLNQ